MVEVIVWADEQASYVRSRSQRYPGAVNVDPEWTNEILADQALVALEPDPKSRVGAARFIGYSPSADRVLVVVAYRDLRGVLHGVNAWPPTKGERAMTAQEFTPELAEAIREESRADEGRPVSSRDTIPPTERRAVEAVHDAVVGGGVGGVAAGGTCGASAGVDDGALVGVDAARRGGAGGT